MSATRSSIRGAWGRLVCTAEHRALTVGLLPALTLLLLALQTSQVFFAGGKWELSPWFVDLWRSDLLVATALCCLSWAALDAAGSRRQRVLLVVAAQGIALAVVVLGFIDLVFFVTTYSTFDLHLLFYFARQPAETLPIVQASVSTGHWILFGLAIASVLVAPWIVRSQFDPEAAPERVQDLGWGRIRTLLIAGLVALVGASLPTLEDADAEFGRSSAINAAFSLYRMLRPIEYDDSRPRLDDVTAEPRAGEPAPEPRGVAVIILESVRARSTTIHEPELETTPFLAALAEESTVAERGYAVVPHTSKALVAILCGVEPRLRLAITESWPDGLPARCLPALLGDHGYRSAFLQSATEKFENRGGLVANMGFDDFIPLEAMDTGGYETINYFGKEDEVMLPASGDWLREVGDAPFLIAYLTVTPHHDYRTPSSFEPFDFAETTLLNRYKNAIRYVDGFVEELFDQYRELGLYDDTLFVIVGDHGQGFGEHGRRAHDDVLWDEGIHIPMMIHDPRARERRRIEAPVSQIDLVPSVLDRLRFEVRGGDLPGASLDDLPADRRVKAYCWYEDRCMATIGPRFKYIDHFGRRSAEVYDLIADPMEQVNRHGQMEERAAAWRQSLDDWRSAVNGFYAR